MDKEFIDYVLQCYAAEFDEFQALLAMVNKNSEGLIDKEKSIDNFKSKLLTYFLFNLKKE